MGAPSTPPGESNGCSAHTFFFCPFLALSLFPHFPPTHPVPSLPFLRSAFVPSLCCPASVVSLLCCVFCFALLLFCLPGLGSVCCLPPPSPRFLAFALLACCVLPLPVLPLLFPPFFRCWLWLSVLVPSLLPPPRLCVCEIPKYRSVGFDVFSIFSPT